MSTSFETFGPHHNESFLAHLLAQLLTFPSRILLSRPFRFIVDTDKVPITVHEAAVAQQSPALAALMQSEMSEGIAGEARWDDVDKGTFARFIQFVYTGDYSVPQSCVVDVSDQHAKRVSYPKPAPAEQPAGPALPRFSSLSYPTPKTQSNMAKASDNLGKTNSKVLLAHASLYVLAEKWGVDTLKQLVLSKLHQTLSGVRLDASKVQDLVDLARYIYSDERTPGLRHGIDKLRELICYYIADNGRVTSEHAMFAALLREEGDLASDLWKIVGSRICIAK